MMTNPTLGDVERWLKSLRLHKYSQLFARLSYEQMLDLTEDYLIAEGVTKGARNKMLASIKKLKLRFEVLTNMIDDVNNDSISIKEALTQLKDMLVTPMRHNNEHLPELYIRTLEMVSRKVLSSCNNSISTISNNHVDSSCRNLLISLLDECIKHGAFSSNLRHRDILERLRYDKRLQFFIPHQSNYLSNHSNLSSSNHHQALTHSFHHQQYRANARVALHQHMNNRSSHLNSFTLSIQQMPLLQNKYPHVTQVPHRHLNQNHYVHNTFKPIKQMQQHQNLGQSNCLNSFNNMAFTSAKNCGGSNGEYSPSSPISPASVESYFSSNSCNSASNLPFPARSATNIKIVTDTSFEKLDMTKCVQSAASSVKTALRPSNSTNGHLNCGGSNGEYSPSSPISPASVESYFSSNSCSSASNLPFPAISEANVEIETSAQFVNFDMAKCVQSVSSGKATSRSSSSSSTSSSSFSERRTGRRSSAESGIFSSSGLPTSSSSSSSFHLASPPPKQTTQNYELNQSEDIIGNNYCTSASEQIDGQYSLLAPKITFELDCIKSRLIQPQRSEQQRSELQLFEDGNLISFFAL